MLEGNDDRPKTLIELAMAGEGAADAADAYFTLKEAYETTYGLANHYPELTDNQGVLADPNGVVVSSSPYSSIAYKESTDADLYGTETDLILKYAHLSVKEKRGLSYTEWVNLSLGDWTRLNKPLEKEAIEEARKMEELRRKAENEKKNSRR